MKKWIIQCILRFICYSVAITLIFNTFTSFQNEDQLAFNDYKNNEPKQEIYKKQISQKIKNQKGTSEEYNANKNQAAINRQILQKQFPDHYLERAITNGYIVRWNPETFPLKVYIEYKADLPEYFYSEVKDAFIEWEYKTNGYINFKFVDSPRNANIKCNFPKNEEETRDFSKKFGGITSSKVKNGILQYMTITFSTKYNGLDRYYTPEIVHSIALHEIGHALGILGHSINSNDIMYSNSSRSIRGISSGDINTIKLIYSIVPDISNKNFTKEKKEKFLTIADILGDEDERIELELSNTLEDSNITKNDPYKLIHIANLYYKKSEYQKAINNYEIAITKIVNDDQLLAQAHYKTSLCYFKIKEYDNALEHIQTSQKLFPSDNTLELTGRIYYKSGNNKAAKHVLVNLLNKNPKIYNAYITLANIYQEEGNTNSWDKLYNISLEYFPDNPPLRRTKIK